MNILLAGRLGNYADRILTLKQRGHHLVYCTLPPARQRPVPDDLGDPSVPRHVLDRTTLHRQLRRIADTHQIDLVYSMKNTWDGSIELVTALLDIGIGPIVRHYKEHFCQPGDAERRTLTETDGQIYINTESLEYFTRTYGVNQDTAHILDTDYLPARYMTGEFRPKLSEQDRRPHLLVSGGVSVSGGRNDIQELCLAMIRHRVHVHIYGMKFVGHDSAGVWGVDNEPASRRYRSLVESGYVHLHSPIGPDRFTAEWSVYDAGLMHVNAGHTHDAPFQPMNQPNRVSTNLAAGLPLAQQDGRQAAMLRLVEQTGIGFRYRDFDELADILHDRARLAELSRVARDQRHRFTFEHNCDELLRVLGRYARN